MPRKWEHDVAVQDLSGSQRVLEVGSGRRAFVERLYKEENINAVGIELNSKAVASAKTKGTTFDKLTYTNWQKKRKVVLMLFVLFKC